MVNVPAAKLPETPAGKPEAVAPVAAPETAYVIVVMAEFTQTA